MEMTGLNARLSAADAENHQEATNRALTAAAVLGAMPPQRYQIEPFSCSGSANYFNCP
jgi:hypothetical protein